MTDAPRLRGNIGRFQYLALGFGTMIGSAWVILLGDWLGKAGPGGAVLGFVAGGVVVVLVGACYAELAGYLPEAGSEFVYARRVYGRGLAFTKDKGLTAEIPKPLQAAWGKQVREQAAAMPDPSTPS